LTWREENGKTETGAVMNETQAERLGRLAFAYCRIATVCLLLGRYALPVAAILSAGLYLAAWITGKKDTKCYLRDPRLAIALWVFVAGGWLWAEFGASAPRWLSVVHR
jgi:hypothetical protein